MKKKSKKQIKSKKQTKSTNPIFSKIDYPSAKEVKKDILEIQASLLNTLQSIENYKAFRKKEQMYKIKLRNNLKDINKNIKKIMTHVPKVPEEDEINQEVKEQTPKIKEKIKEKKQQTNIESKLKNIQERLESLS